MVYRNVFRVHYYVLKVEIIIRPNHITENYFHQASTSCLRKRNLYTKKKKKIASEMWKMEKQYRWRTHNKHICGWDRLCLLLLSWPAISTVLGIWNIKFLIDNIRLRKEELQQKKMKGKISKGHHKLVPNVWCVDLWVDNVK